MNFLIPTTSVKQNRTQWLDYDKGITILLVGYGHCLATLTGNVTNLKEYSVFTYISAFFYGFRMPLFFIVSGMLIGNNLQRKGLTKYIISRFNLLYAMMVWGIIEITLKLLSHSDSATPWFYFYLLVDPRQTGHFWYLNALAFIGIIYSFAKNKLRLQTVHQLSIGLLLYVISSYILLHNIQAGFFIDIGRHYFFFALGDAIFLWVRNEKTQLSLATWKLFVPLLIFFTGLQYYCTTIILQHPDYGNRFIEVNLPALYFAEALVGCATSISLSFLLQKHKLFRWLTVIGTYSLFIYLMQVIVMSFTRSILQNLFHISTPALIVSIWIIGTLLPIVLYRLFMSTGFWWLFSFRKPEMPLQIKVIEVRTRLKNTFRKYRNPSS